ncbi:hypothetical protein SLE2022_101000 [Rubroshorea leprosula]
MDTHQQQRIKDKVVEKKQEEGKINSSASPPSASSSPSHEFSFTISLHSSTTADKTKPPPSIAIDLSPADDIFFHGHLLPLRILSHLPVSPRSSTNSLGSFSLPISDELDDKKPDERSSNCCTSNSNGDIKSSIPNNETKGRKKHKSFSLFWLGKWQKGHEERDTEDEEKLKKKKMRFNVSHVLKRYVRMVRPLLFFRGRGQNLHLRQPPYSFSGNLSDLRNIKHELRGRRGQYSAPASMRTSPTNSGLLVATAPLPSSASDSTMEELQAAIQAAIAHCKKSIGVEDKLNS